MKERRGADDERWQGGQLADGQHVVGDRALQLGPTHEPYRNCTGSPVELCRRIRVVETNPGRAPLDVQVAEEGETREIDEVEEIEVIGNALWRPIEDDDGPLIRVRQEPVTQSGVERRLTVV